MSKQGRGWFEVRPGQHRPKLVRNGALFFIFLSLCVYIMYFRPPVPVLSSTGKEIEADIASQVNIRPGFTPVRVAGINVGQVTEVKPLGPENGFRITMEFDKGTGVKKVHSDATAVSRWRTLLGRNHYIDLDPGSPGNPELSGPIPQTRTGDQVEIDDAIEPLDAKGRRSFGTIIDEFEKGFKSPKAVRSAVSSVAPAMRRLAPALRAFEGTEEGDLPRLVQQTSRAMGALSRDEVALGGLVDQGAIALGVTAAKRADLGATLRLAPAALRQTRSTMVRLRQTLDEVDPVAEDLRPGARKLDEAAIEARGLLRRTSPLLKDARPALRDLRPALGSARQAGVSGTPALRNLQPILDKTQEKLIPFFNETHPESGRKNFQMVGPTLGSASSLVARGDKQGALATFQAGAGERGFASSPCNTRLFDKYSSPEEKLNCELLVQSILDDFGGGAIPANEVRNRAVPASMVEAIRKGTTTVKQAAETLKGTAAFKATASRTTAGKRGGR